MKNLLDGINRSLDVQKEKKAIFIQRPNKSYSK